MNIQLRHEFVNEPYALEILEKIVKNIENHKYGPGEIPNFFGELTTLIKKCADKYAEREFPPLTQTDTQTDAQLSLQKEARNEFCGKMFELFVEFFIKYPRSGQYLDGKTYVDIRDYQPLPSSEEDTGVDGLGVDIEDDPVAVQIKYRSNPTEPLTANKDHLGNFLSAAILRYGVIAQDQIFNKEQFKKDRNNIFSHLQQLDRSKQKRCLYIFTTSEGMHEFTEHKMLCGLVRLISGSTLRNSTTDPQFWRDFLDSINHSKIPIAPEPPKSLRQDQKDTVQAVLADVPGLGIVQAPTGYGKTLVQADIIMKMGKE